MPYVIIAPIYIQVGVKKKKKHYINLNGYRNWAFHLSNELKKTYATIVSNTDEFKQLPKLGKVKLTYKIFYHQNRDFDIDNIGAISGKFFQDTLVKHNKIDDDNHKYIPEIVYMFGGIDRSNPRVEVHIEEI